MKLTKIETGNFKLDGGALFGVIPKSIWNKVYPADENNLCNLSMRCLLVETGDHKILIDTGIGNKQNDKFFGYYFLNGDYSLENSLHSSGIKLEDITDVILTHLHFDHCGGALKKDNTGKIVPTFPHADYWISRRQWSWAGNPNQREKASFLKENFEPLKETGKLRFVDEDWMIEGIRIRSFQGHSDGMIIPFVTANGHTFVFMADLIPTSAHIPESWICGYDTQPLVSMEERKKFLEEAADNQYILFFEHDIAIECCTVKRAEKGVRMDRSYSLQELTVKYHME
jgi:glyoxylase-like metal-dependent hydrolase (beta-lactamase superfamily II)